MKLERILQAAVNSMIHGKHKPHCYSAHVQGQGYVNKGNVLEQREDYLKKLERTATSEIENMLFSDSYAEPGYDNPEKYILFADWNSFPTELPNILERAGYAIEWSDEWATCEHCNRAMRTSPDSYVWTPYYVIENDCEIVCLDCKEDN